MTPPPEELAKVEWDAVVIGTGVGGATLGYALARAGERVLFLERGENYLGNPRALRGDYMETLAASAPDSSEEDNFRNGGRWRGEIFDAAQNRYFRPFLGAGAGGGSALYGMLMERFFPSDFTPRRFHAADTESDLPDRWPILYEDLRPHYEKAEELYRLQSEIPDPCRRGEALRHIQKARSHHLATRHFERFLRWKKIGVYTPAFACEWKDECRFCQSMLCDKDCKNDAARVCLRPALASHGAALLSGFTVDRLEADRGRVTAVNGRGPDGREHRFRGRRVVLAAGALATPLLLLRSRSEHWPRGLANGSGTVGRYLMRHLIDIYFLPSVWNFRKAPQNLKELAWNDYYEVDGVKYGTFQPFGKFPPGGLAVDDLLFEMKQNIPGWAMRGLNLLRPGLSFALETLFAHSGCAAPIMEDLPQKENRVEEMPAGPDGRERVAVHYRISAYDRTRLKKFRCMIGRVFFPYLTIRFSMAETCKMMAHACGTARFGDDPATSVLNKWNRAHEVENLYIVDASFFPSSGGINPSLTIAANALRVAERLIQEKC